MIENRSNWAASLKRSFDDIGGIFKSFWFAAEKMPPACCGIRLNRYLRLRAESVSSTGNRWGVKM